jgi:UDP-N-acetyl-D-mannosaminuronic acid dehydrogenase
VGLGYIGLPTAAVLASRGVDVVGFDVDKKVVETINQGKIHIVEPDLDIAVNSVVNTGKLRAVNAPESADAFLVAVPTPFKAGHEPDLSYIEAVSVALAPVLEKNNLIILESTSPVGATEKMIEWLSAERPDLKFPVVGDHGADVFVAHCPERVLPGQVLRELVENDRVIGGVTEACAAAAADLYRLFVQGDLHVTNVRTAEMAKLTENAFRDVNIAFANELSTICDRLDIDVWELIDLANHHPRVNILQPGPGVGGHCIAVDPWFIVASAPDRAHLIRAARQVNDEKPEFVTSKICERAEDLKARRIGVLGLAFKPDVDDLRQSPALRIAEELSKATDYQLLIVEPHIEVLPPSLASRANVTLVDLQAVSETADMIVVLVKHRAFAEFHGLSSFAASRRLDFVNLSNLSAPVRG